MAMGCLGSPCRWSRIDHRLDFLLQPDCVAATKAWPDRLARGQALHGPAVRRGRPGRLRPTRKDARPVADAGVSIFASRAAVTRTYPKTTDQLTPLDRTDPPQP